MTTNKKMNDDGDSFIKLLKLINNFEKPRKQK